MRRDGFVCPAAFAGMSPEQVDSDGAALMGGHDPLVLMCLPEAIEECRSSGGRLFYI